MLSAVPRPQMTFDGHGIAVPSSSEPPRAPPNLPRKRANLRNSTKTPGKPYVTVGAILELLAGLRGRHIKKSAHNAIQSRLVVREGLFSYQLIWHPVDAVRQFLDLLHLEGRDLWEQEE